MEDLTETHQFPQKPEEPVESDCCGTGCIPCVFDIYESELRLWSSQCAEIQRRGRGGNSAKTDCTEKVRDYSEM